MNRFLAASTVALAAALLLVAPSARAATAGSTLSVSATVAGICVIDPAALTFATPYDSTQDVTAQATITVRCTQNSSYWIGLGNGQHHSGTTRRMADVAAGGTLEYELYRTSGFSQLWNDLDPGAASHRTAGQAGFSSYTETVYGRIPAGQTAPIGTAYGDTVTMTVNF